MNASAVTLPDAEPALRVVPMPADANQHGDIFGGWVMSQVDIAGSIPASRRARGIRHRADARDIRGKGGHGYTLRRLADQPGESHGDIGFRGGDAFAYGVGRVANQRR